MYTDEDLDTAVESGIFTAQSVAQFRDQIATKHQAPAVDEENFRLVTSFNDIFVVIACGLMMACSAWVLGLWSEAIGLLAYPVLSWVLAEFFVRQRKMALPAIALLLSFVGGLFFFCEQTFAAMGDDVHMVSMAVSAIGAYLHWRRFRVPITVAAGVGTFFGFVIAVSISTIPNIKDWLMTLVFCAGLATFVIAMAWDSSDTKRLTHHSDVAFWLHLLAAPMIAHPVFYSLGVFEGSESLDSMLIIIALYAVVTVISLVIDRRAFMVSSLGYVLYAISKILEAYGDIGYSFAITGVIIGSILLLLSAFWHSARSWVIRFMPDSIRQRVPAISAT